MRMSRPVRRECRRECRHRGLSLLGILAACAAGGACSQARLCQDCRTNISDEAKPPEGTTDSGSGQANPVHPTDGSAPRVVVETSMGNFTVELDPRRAPVTVDNFLQYAREGFYDGTIIHRVVNGPGKRIQVIQGGGHLPDMTLKKARPPIPCEADNGLRNVRGTIAMARDAEPHTADSQFFINTEDNPRLDYHSRGPDFWGYAVFGRVVEGMEVIDRVRQVPTGGDGDLDSPPLTPVVVRRVVAK